MIERLEVRIEAVLASGGGTGRADDLLAEGYAEALKLDSERLALERHITALAARADDRATAQELRRSWLRHRTLGRELGDLRALLRRLKEFA